MHQFMSYVEEHSPDYLLRFRGSSPGSIDEYASVVGQQLPHFYIQYLETMGDSDGGLLVFEDAQTSASQLVNFYRRSVLTGESSFPTGTTPVAVNGWTLNEACISLANPIDGQVFSNRDDQIDFVYSDSLQSLLFKKAFVSIGMNAFSKSGMYLARDSEPRIDLVRTALLGQHTQLEWFSDSVGVAAQLDEVSVFARQYTGGSCWVRIAGHSQSAINAMARHICTPCGLDFDRWWVPPPPRG